jgi:uncharacterized protein DUF1707
MTGVDPPSQGEPPVLATDDDRGRTMRALDFAYARGALDNREWERRVTQASAAQRVEELVGLIADLPAPAAAELEEARRARELGEWVLEWRWWLGGAVILTAVWGVQVLRSGPEFYWPVVPLGIWAAVLLAVAIWPSGGDRGGDRP